MVGRCCVNVEVLKKEWDLSSRNWNSRILKAAPHFLDVFTDFLVIASDCFHVFPVFGNKITHHFVLPASDRQIKRS